MDWLIGQGVIPGDDKIQRVVIDASYDSAVHIYWQGLGADNLIKGNALDSLLQAELKKLG